MQVYRLTDLVGLEESPAISPDGKSVAFVAEIAGRRQIWLRLLAGGTPLAITKDDVDHYGPRWSPDSGSIIYYAQANQPGEPGTIWEISALGGTPQRIVSALSPGDLSRDGRDLAFFRFHESSIELAVASRDGSQTRDCGETTRIIFTTIYAGLPITGELRFCAKRAERTLAIICSFKTSPAGKRSEYSAEPTCFRGLPGPRTGQG